MPMSLSTHAYDGKLDKNITEGLAASDTAALEELRRLADVHCPQRIRADAIRALNLMIKGAGNNYDTSDGLQAEDLAAGILEIIRGSDLLDEWYIWEQIADIMGGTCPQGRVKRLYQVYMCITGIKVTTHY